MFANKNDQSWRNWLRVLGTKSSAKFYVRTGFGSDASVRSARRAAFIAGQDISRTQDVQRRARVGQRPTDRCRNHSDACLFALRVSDVGVEGGEACIGREAFGRKFRPGPQTRRRSGGAQPD